MMKSSIFMNLKKNLLRKRNDWEHRISKIKDNIPRFEFKHIEKMAYAAGPGSYTGAGLAFTFLDTLSLIINKKFYAFSNLTALQHNHPERVAVMKEVRTIISIGTVVPIIIAIA